MDGTDTRLRDAHQLEDLNFNQWIRDASVKADGGIKASERDLAARGVLQSGMRYKAMADIILVSIEGVADQAIALRKELCGKVPDLLEPGNLKAFQDKLNRYVDGGVISIRQRSATSQLGSASGKALSGEAERKAQALKARLNQKLLALPLEARLGLHRTGEPAVNTFNISNSTIANLNLGNVVGDLNSSIQQLNTAGRIDLAEEFRKLADALGSSQELQDDARKEMLEHLSIVSEESAKPPELRKMGPLKSSLLALKSGIGVAAQLFGIYQGLEHALKATGVIPG